MSTNAREDQGQEPGHTGGPSDGADHHRDRRGSECLQRRGRGAARIKGAAVTMRDHVVSAATAVDEQSTVTREMSSNM